MNPGMVAPIAVAAKRRRQSQGKFLLEIGVEEIPDWMIVPALDHLKASFERVFSEHRLGGTVAWVDATPRRLTLLAEKLKERQEDAEEVVSGPPKSAGEGAAQGFARKLGVTLDQLESTVTPKGEYFSYRRKIEGRDTKDVLASVAPGAILSIPWPKTMYWTGKGGVRFIRPIRWIVALFEQDVVPFEVAGVDSGDVSAGHRRFGKPRVKVTVLNYAERLRANQVLVRAEERRRMIVGELARMEVAHNIRVKSDAALLDTLIYLTEWPMPIVGSFDPSYLTLPREVLVTVMRHHQKYFSVEDASGTLAPRFVAVMNVPGDPDGLVVHGNERVLRARFNDARFFWETDQRKKLADRVEDLRNVTYQKQLGSYFDKAQRNVALVRELGGNEHAARAALLAKCDLTTEMVKEFTELQGVVGGLYARVQGESEETARAIYDHYKPVSMEDSVPATEVGQLVALADKLDTLRESFRIGLAPKGSSDPYALRRAAQGVVKILAEGARELDLASLLGGDKTLEDFFADRVRYYFREIRGFRYDEVNAVMARGWSRLKDVRERLEAVKAVRPTENFEPLAASFKRIRNILDLAKFEGGSVDVSLFKEDAERQLHRAMLSLRLEGLGYREQLEAIASLRKTVDGFFDEVLVNTPEEAVRANRLALLDSLRREFSRIADFSEIATA